MSELLMVLREKGAWILTRYQKGYGLMGCFIQAFTFAGIYSIVLEPYFDIPRYLFLPIIAIGGLIGLVLFGILMYDKGNFQTAMTEKDGSLNDYFHKKLTPIQKKQLMIIIEAIENKDNIEDIKLRIASGFL